MKRLALSYGYRQRDARKNGLDSSIDKDISPSMWRLAYLNSFMLVHYHWLGDSHSKPSVHK